MCSKGLSDALGRRSRDLRLPLPGCRKVIMASGGDERPSQLEITREERLLDKMIHGEETEADAEEKVITENCEYIRKFIDSINLSGTKNMT